MNKKLKYILGLALALVVGYSVARAEQGPRFELKRQEYINAPISDLIVSAVHDKESGLEFVCTGRWNGIYSLSCVPTGRNWK
jgi:hypothetical protein